MTELKLVSLLVCNEVISSPVTIHTRVFAFLTWAMLIEIIVKIGGVVEAVRFFTELASRVVVG